MGFLLLVKVPVLWMGISPKYTGNSQPLPPIDTRYHPLFLFVPRRHSLSVITRYQLSPVTTRGHPLQPVVTRFPSSAVVTRIPSSTVGNQLPLLVSRCTHGQPLSSIVPRRQPMSPVVTCCDPSSLVTLRHPLSPVFNCCTLLSPVTSLCHPLSPDVTRYYSLSPVVSLRLPS